MRKASRHAQHTNYIVLTAVLITVILFCVFFLSIRSKAGSNGDPDTGRVKLYTSVYIHEGDTLWSIAETYMSEEYESIDHYVAELKEINHVGNNIHAGCYLTVSYYAEPGR